MYAYRVLIAALIAALAAVMVSCSGGGTPQASTLRPGDADISAGEDNVLSSLPAPSQLKSTSIVESGIFRHGSQYQTEWPNQLVTAKSLNLQFQPEWADSGLQGAAFALYAFDCTGYVVNPAVYVTWDKIGMYYTDVWIGLANFDLDRWDWSAVSNDGVRAFNRVTYMDKSIVYVAVVCIGQDEWELKHIRIGSGIPPIVDSVYPRYVNKGLSAVITAKIDGQVDNYWWDFGGGTDPNNSNGNAVSVMPLEIGVYPSSLVVSNKYGTDTYNFDLHVLKEPGPGPWAMFGHDTQHTRCSTYLGAQTNNLQWSAPTDDGIYSSPAVGADGTVYVGSDDQYLYAFYPDGSLRWKFKTGGSVWGSPTIGESGIVYVGSFDRRLYAINPNGTMRWNFVTGDWVRSSPSIGADGTIYFGSRDTRIYALDSTGKLIWSYETGDAVDSSPALGADGTIYIGSDDFNLYAMTPEGALKWTFPTGDMVWAAPAIGSDGTVYVGSYDNTFYAITPDGDEKWSYTTGFKVGSSAAIGSDGTIYFGSYDHHVYALDANGTLKWRYETGDSVRSSPALGSDGTIYIGSDDNSLYALSPSGLLKWAYTTSWYAFSSPAIGDAGLVYAGSYDGRLYVIGP